MKVLGINPNVNNIKKITSSKVGYVRPDKTIKFLNSKAANEYAKNIVTKALKIQNPFEKCVLINKDTVIKEINGNNEHVEINTAGLVFDTMVHGHPDCFKKGLTYPINFRDTMAFFECEFNGLKKSIVYNSNGEYSMIETENATNTYKKPIPIQIELQNHTNRRKAYSLDLQQAQETMDRFSELKRSGKLLELVNDIHDENFIEIIFAQLECSILHKMMKDNAKNLGLKYKTNFSYLK